MRPYPTTPRSIAARRPAVLPALVALVILAALAGSYLTRPAWSQVAAGGQSPEVGPTARLTLLRTGTFEAWQDTTRLGTEFYRVYITAQRDSVIAASAVHYLLHDRRGSATLEKRTVSISRALDSYPLFYQSHQQIGGRTLTFGLTTSDTTANFYREAEGRGIAKVIGVPPGRLYVLDPSVYERVEAMVTDFFASPAQSRLQNVVMTPRDTVVQVRLTRGPLETIDLPGRGKVQATRVDLFDDLTLIQTWVDEHGLLLQVVAPQQKFRLVRLPPGKDEAEAAAEAKGAPLTTR